MLRCFVFIGVCVEFVAAVAWLAELFPEPSRREKVLGYTQAFSSLGGLLVATANGLCVTYAASLPAIGAFGIGVANPHAPWRYTLMSGVIPAIPLILIRPFLPESPVWQQKKAAGTLQAAEHRRAVRARAAPDDDRDDADVRDGVWRGVRRDSADAADRARACPKCVKMTAGKPAPQARAIEQRIASDVTKVQEIGGLAGRVAARGARRSHRQPAPADPHVPGPGLIVMPLVFAWMATHESEVALHRDLPRRVPDRRAVQLLGQLSAARVSRAPARHR